MISIFSANELNIFPKKWPAAILFLLGGVFIVPAVLLISNLISFSGMLGHILLGTGLVLFSPGLFLIFSHESLKVSINSSRGVIEVVHKYFKDEFITDFPLSYFDRIAVRENIEITAKNTPRIAYEVLLEQKGYSRLKIFSHENREKAFHLAEELQHRIMLDIYYHDKKHREPDFILKDTNAPDDIILTQHTMLTKVQGEAAILYQWSKKYFLYYLFSLLPLLYGLFHIIRFAFISDTGLGLSPLVGYIIFGLITGIILSFFLAHTLLKKNISLERESLCYYTSFLGIKSKKVSMFWDDVAMIKNSLNFGECTFNIISNRGMDIFEDFSELFSKKVSFNETQLEMLKALAVEQLEVHVGDLPLSDRIRIEEDVREFLL